jgi:glycine betaine catabolism B
MELEFIKDVPRTDNVKSFIFMPKQSVVWKPGQYMDFEIPHPSPDERGTHHWFTISSAPFERNIMITTRLSRDGSSFKKALAGLRPGDIISSGLPRGDFVVEDLGSHYIFIAGGIGITPFRSMLLQLDHEHKPISVDLLYLNSDDNYVFEDEFTALEKKNRHFKLHKYTDRRLDNQDLADYYNSPDSVFYLSGPRGMVESYQKLLESEISADRIKTDYFPGY